MAHCKKHKYHYKEYCWFCFCEHIKRPHDFAYYGMTAKEREQLDEFIGLMRTKEAE